MDFIKRTMYLGLGLASMTKERVDAIADELSKYSKMSEEEGKKLADYLKDESEKARKDLDETINRIVAEAVAKTPCNKRITELEARIARLEATVGTIPEEQTAEPHGSCCTPESEAPEPPPEAQTSGRHE